MKPSRGLSHQAPHVTLDGATRIDTPAVYAALEEQRRARGLTWGQVATEIGVAASTLTNLANGPRTGFPGFEFMFQWLGVPSETFLRRPAGSSLPGLMTQLSVLIRAQPGLTPAAAAELETIARGAYERLRAAPGE